MGNFFNSASTNTQYQTLKDEFDDYKKNIDKLIDNKLYTKIDLDDNGILTRNEFDEWISDYKHKMNGMINKVKQESENKIDTLKQQFQESMAEKNAKISELQCIIKTLQSTNNELEQYNKKLIQNVNNPNNCPDLKSIISKTKINEYVNEILENEKINISGLPDAIEKAIYKNVIRIILLVIDKLADKAKIDLFGHEMRLIIT